MKIGDKVRILIGIRTGQTGTIQLINDNHVDDYLVKVEDGDVWYDESELEPVIEHKFKVGDKVIVNGHNAEITYVTYADNNPYRVRYDNGVMGWYDESELEPISDHMTADELAELIATPTEEDEIDNLLSNIPTMSEDYKTYEDGLKEGYKKGFNAGVKQTRDKVVDALFTVVKI